jgi:hypothetical protein
MSAPEDKIADYAGRLYDQLGERALDVVHDMLAHLEHIHDRARIEDWQMICAVVTRLCEVGVGGQGSRKPRSHDKRDLWLKALIKLEELERRRRGQ